MIKKDKSLETLCMENPFICLEVCALPGLTSWLGGLFFFFFFPALEITSKRPGSLEERGNGIQLQRSSWEGPTGGAETPPVTLSGIPLPLLSKKQDFLPFVRLHRDQGNNRQRYFGGTDQRQVRETSPLSPLMAVLSFTFP